MDWKDSFYEDLSEEVLGENVSASCVKTSKKLLSNMGESPFNRKAKRKQLPNSSFLSIRYIPQFKGFKDKKLCNKHFLSKDNTKICLNSFDSQSCPRKSKLQTEIKGLLNQVIKLKSSPSSMPYSHRNSKKARAIALNEEALVTVNDIQSAE
ncbi:unnamed protein product [Moneuplotes crassus]|uniref:Uncharacterized protein n=1 Tax=Euplotes crassus TaxID=5936 RepID=A0AAD1Y845_EUPCR|nr:unnamed protein product [Moneuplotes crassus]